MKRSFKIFIFLIISLYLFNESHAQVSKLTLRSSLSNSDNLLINVTGVDDYRTTLEILKAWLYSNDINVTGSMIFNQGFQLAPSPTVSLQRGFSFSGNKPAYTLNGEVIPLANMNDLANAGLGSGTGYARTDATNNFTATQNFNAGAAIANGQTFGLGRLSSPLTIGSNKMGYSNLGGYINYSWVDANNDKGTDSLATLRKLRELGVGTTSGQYIKATGSQTGLNPILGFLSSTIFTFNGLFDATGGRIKIGERASTGYGDITYNLTQGVDGIYYGASDYSPSATNVDNRIASKVNYTSYSMPAINIDLNQNYNVYKKSISTNTVFTFSNLKEKVVQLFVSATGSSYILFSVPSGYSIKYPDGSAQPGEGKHLYQIQIIGTEIFIIRLWTVTL